MSQTARIFDSRHKAEAEGTSEEKTEVRSERVLSFLTVGLTLPGMLRSMSGNEMIPSSFPNLRTTIVAIICRSKVRQHSRCWNVEDRSQATRNLLGRAQHMLKMENCKTQE